MFVTYRLDTVDSAGEPVATTVQGGMYLGVPVIGEDVVEYPSPPVPPVPGGEPRSATEIAIGGGDAHSYTECARIWNPIHTDRAVARSAGLDDIILHGTATLAHGVSEVVRREADGDPTRVRRIVGQFRAMVLMPSTITVRILGRVRVDDRTDAVAFDVRNEQGGAAVDNGVIVLERRAPQPVIR